MRWYGGWCRGPRTLQFGGTGRLRTPAPPPPQGASPLQHHRTGQTVKSPSFRNRTGLNTSPPRRNSSRRRRTPGSGSPASTTPRSNASASPSAAAGCTGRANGATPPDTSSKSSSPRSRRGHASGRGRRTQTSRRNRRSDSRGGHPWDQPQTCELATLRDASGTPNPLLTSRDPPLRPAAAGENLGRTGRPGERLGRVDCVKPRHHESPGKLQSPRSARP